MKTRLIIGPVLLALVALLMWGDWWLMSGGPLIPPGSPSDPEFWTLKPWGFIALALLFLWVCGVELLSMLDKCGMRADRVALGLTGVAALGLSLVQRADLWESVTDGPQRFATSSGAILLPVMVFVLVMTCARGIWHKDVKNFPGTLAATLLAFMYVIVPGVLLLSIRGTYGIELVVDGEDISRNRDPHLGLWLVIWLVVVCRLGADSCAYFAGKAMGKRKLIPHVSPGKTVEGFIGGLVGAALLSWGCWHVMPGLALVVGELEVIALGAAMGLIAPIGDLTASALKRGAGVKDSGKLIPEFGGSLDLIDAFLLTGPALALVMLWKGA